MSNKSFSNWEKTTGLFAVNEKKYDSSKLMSEEQFIELVTEGDFTGVSYDDRVKFLELNGYEVNRENLLADLSVRPKQD